MNFEAVVIWFFGKRQGSWFGINVYKQTLIGLANFDIYLRRRSSTTMVSCFYPNPVWASCRCVSPCWMTVVAMHRCPTIHALILISMYGHCFLRFLHRNRHRRHGVAFASLDVETATWLLVVVDATHTVYVGFTFKRLLLWLTGTFVGGCKWIEREFWFWRVMKY